ncbi:hypothetical protein GCM10020220_054210 [Nonomuraea rubra]
MGARGGRLPAGQFEIGKDGAGLLVVGFDGSGPSRNALAYAAGLARRDDATLLNRRSWSR